MRDIKQLHPNLQGKIINLQNLCQENGISIGIGECLRTVKEQDALYAQGRTKPGAKVTNAKGSTYSSMHQWGVAFDFYLLMDVDGDGKVSDDAFNNATKLFNKVGKLGQSIGLEWGGSWKNPVDMPHFQLPDWGSTTKVLKSTYGTPDRFISTYGETLKTNDTVKVSPVITPSKTQFVVESAKRKNKTLAGTYITTANLNLRAGAGTSKPVLLTIPKGSKVICYGYYNVLDISEPFWLFVQYGKYTGFVSHKYLSKE